MLNMDKYIIDGVEYSYGEEVEVGDDGDWAVVAFASVHDLES